MSSETQFIESNYLTLKRVASGVVGIQYKTIEEYFVPGAPANGKDYFRLSLEIVTKKYPQGDKLRLLTKWEYGIESILSQYNQTDPRIEGTITGWKHLSVGDF